MEHIIMLKTEQVQDIAMDMVQQQQPIVITQKEVYNQAIEE